MAVLNDRSMKPLRQQYLLKEISIAMLRSKRRKSRYPTRSAIHPDPRTIPGITCHARSRPRSPRRTHQPKSQENSKQSRAVANPRPTNSEAQQTRPDNNDQTDTQPNNHILQKTEHSIGGRTRHVNVREWFLRDLKEEGSIEVKCIAGDDNSADLFIKNLQGPLFEKHTTRAYCGNDEYMKAKLQVGD
jgi:hypothetical protein